MDDSTLLPIWSALADAKRRQILELLEERPHTTSELCEHFDVSRFAVMKHLNVLEQANLIVVRREGRKRWNILKDRPIDPLTTGKVDVNGSLERPSRPLSLTSAVTQVPSSLETIGSATIDQETMLKATPEDVFRALTEGIDAWWRWRSPDACGVYLEPAVNGRFYQVFDRDKIGHDGEGDAASEDGELLARITYIKRNEEIRLDGPMGLTEAEAISYIRLRLEPGPAGTRLLLHHHLIGRIDEPMVERFKSHWHELLNSDLKAFVEEGLSL